jgi:hypothetical protein
VTACCGNLKRASCQELSTDLGEVSDPRCGRGLGMTGSGQIDRVAEPAHYLLQALGHEDFETVQFGCLGSAGAGQEDSAGAGLSGHQSQGESASNRTELSVQGELPDEHGVFQRGCRDLSRGGQDSQSNR